MLTCNPNNYESLEKGVKIFTFIRENLNNEIFSNNNPYYREHEDVAHGGKVSTLTEKGLEEYIKIRKSEEAALTKNISNIIEYNIEVDSNFSQETREKIKNALNTSKEKPERHSYIIHRDGHTVSLIIENQKVLLLDPYNAHGVEDLDHFPLLKIIRDTLPNAEIYTLYDKMQNDYYNCRIFALENLIEIERYCQMHDCNLSQIIDSGKKTFFDKDSVKEKFYKKHSITAIPTPICITPHIQSIKQIKKLTKDFELLKIQRSKNQTYWEYLKNNIKIIEERERNCTIENQAQKIKTKLLLSRNRYNILLKSKNFINYFANKVINKKENNQINRQ